MDETTEVSVYRPPRPREEPEIAATQEIPVVAETSQWGQLPQYSLVVALSLLIVAGADTAARLSVPGAEIGFWLGSLALFVPSALRIAAVDGTRRERLGLVCLLAVGLYVV